MMTVKARDRIYSRNLTNNIKTQRMGTGRTYFCVTLILQQCATQITKIYLHIYKYWKRNNPDKFLDVAMNTKTLANIGRYILKTK